MTTDGLTAGRAGQPGPVASSTREILRVFNNNVVLVRDEQDHDLILTGRGIGFHAHPGDRVDPAKVVRVFAPTDGRDPDHLAELMAGIAPEQIHLASDALLEAGLGARAAAKPTLVIAVADHVSFALRRLKAGTNIEYPLQAEVQHLYAAEYQQGRDLLAALNARLGEVLPDTEAVALTLHLVNAGFATGDLAHTYAMTGVIQQMLAVISETYGMRLDPSSVNVGRFITHLRYLFVRMHQGKQLQEAHHSGVGDAIRSAFPEALSCARRVAAVVELRQGTLLTDDEVSYLTLHIARVTTDEP